MPTIFDHLLIIAFCVGIPVWGILTDTAEGRKELAASPTARLKQCWLIFAIEWALVAALAVLWAVHDRSVEDLGLIGSVDTMFWLGAALVAIALAALVFSQHRSVRTAAQRLATRDLFERIAPFVPRSVREYRHFVALAITAGICEEVLYRGYLFWYAAAFLGDGPWVWTGIVFGGAILFALAHLYQGVAGAAQVLVVGLAMGGLYLLSGSIILCIIAHAVMDLSGLWLATRVFSHPEADPPNTESAETVDPPDTAHLPT